MKVFKLNQNNNFIIIMWVINTVNKIIETKDFYQLKENIYQIITDESWQKGKSSL